VRGDREVSGSGVCKGVGEAPTFTEWSMMMVPTYYPEDDSRALKVYQHQHTIVVRVGHKAPVVRVEGEQLSRDCVGRFGAETFTVRQRAARSIRPRMLCVPSTKSSFGRK
jgi:hypothetical protein